MRGLIKVKRELISSIRAKEIQLAKLREHIDKSEVCSDLYNKMLIEKAILTKQLEDLQSKSFVNRIKHLLPKNEKLICDYFGGR
jgi:DNA-binding MarR family transcriptional regulator